MNHELSTNPADIDLGQLRTFIRSILRRRGASERHVEDWAVVATELAVNAIEASPTPDARIHVSFHVDDLEATLAVSDDGPGLNLDVAPAPPGLRGRGLLLARALTDRMTVTRTNNVNRVTAHRVIEPG